MLWVGLLVESFAHAMKQVTARPTILLLGALAVCAAGGASAAGEDPYIIALSDAVGSHTPGLRRCTADELLPRKLPDRSHVGRVSLEWSRTGLVKPPYGCDCSFYKGRYFCPHLADRGYRAWVPQAVADGVCKTVTRSDLHEAPLPPNFKVSIYGNSHLRQIVEAMMCMFHEKVKTKRVRYHHADYNDDERTVAGDTVCRACWHDRDLLPSHGCMSEGDVEEGCRCSDDHSEFVFENGATLHYFFAHDEGHKSLSDSLPRHGNVSWSWYDAVFANQGNDPGMLPEAVLTASAELQEASVPFFWLNTFEGRGDVSRWYDASQRARFHELGAKHVRTDAMAHGMHKLTKGAIEHTLDRHFCLPGPPDEMALLLMKMMWAVHFES